MRGLPGGNKKYPENVYPTAPSYKSVKQYKNTPVWDDYPDHPWNFRNLLTPPPPPPPQAIHKHTPMNEKEWYPDVEPKYSQMFPLYS